MEEIGQCQNKPEIGAEIDLHRGEPVDKQSAKAHWTNCIQRTLI